MLPSFTIPLHKSNIHWVPISPVALSFLLPAPTILGLYAFSSPLVLLSLRPSWYNVLTLTSADYLWSHSFSSFISFSMYSFQESLIHLSSTITWHYNLPPCKILSKSGFWFCTCMMSHPSAQSDSAVFFGSWERLNGDVLVSNSAFFIFAVLVVWFSHSCPYKMF